MIPTLQPQQEGGEIGWKKQEAGREGRKEG